MFRMHSFSIESIAPIHSSIIGGTSSRIMERAVSLLGRKLSKIGTPTRKQHQVFLSKMPVPPPLGQGYGPGDEHSRTLGIVDDAYDNVDSDQEEAEDDDDGDSGDTTFAVIPRLKHIRIEQYENDWELANRGLSMDEDVVDNDGYLYVYPNFAKAPRYDSLASDADNDHASQVNFGFEYFESCPIAASIDRLSASIYFSSKRTASLLPCIRARLAHNQGLEAREARGRGIKESQVPVRGEVLCSSCVRYEDSRLYPIVVDGGNEVPMDEKGTKHAVWDGDGWSIISVLPH